MNFNKKDEYWTKRAEQRLLNAENLTSDMLKDLKTTYEQSIKAIQKEINAFYGKYSTETGLDITEVRKRLDKSELKEFKKQLALYYDEVKRLGGYSKDTKQYLRELSAKAYISRLEELQANIRWEVENLYRQQQLRIFEVLSKGYEETYYRANFDMQKGIGFAYEFNALNSRLVEKAVTQKWQGSNFSDRVWNDKVKLIDTLNQTIPQGIALGQNPRKVARTIAKTMETKFSNAERLARTEMNHICNDASRDAYKETPEVLQEYKIVATLDNRTSDICQNQDNKVYKMSEWEEGITAPPFHPNCFSDDTEVYTKEGWKLFKDCKENDLYYSLNPETFETEYLKANKKISYLYTGNLLNFTNRSFDLCVTPEHQILLKYNKKDGTNKLRFISADKMPKYNNSIPRGIKWTGQDIKTVKFGNYDIDIDLYLKFMGYYLSEGSCTKIKDKNSYRIKISQEKYLKEMYEDLKQLPFEITLTKEAINCYKYDIGKELEKYGKSYQKYIPDIIKTLTSEKIRMFLDAYILGDGSNRENHYKDGNFENEKVIFTSSTRMMNDLTELALKAGYRPSFNLLKAKGIPVNHKNGIYSGNYDIWCIRLCTRLWTMTDNLKREEIKYSGYVYCVELPKYHTLLVRRNGKICWCGNCRSTTVPYFADVDLSDYTRLATDYSTGQAYYVPANMSYKEWRASLTEKQDKAFISDKKAREQHAEDKKQLAEYRKLMTVAKKNGQSELFADVPSTLGQFQAMKYSNPEKYEIVKENARIVRSLK